MTPEAQRIAIAEACGWTLRTESDGEIRLMKPDGRPAGWSDFDPHVTWRYVTHRLPDYLNDLNAMHEAEKVLTEAQRFVYARELYRLIPGIWLSTYAEALEFDELFTLAHATAAQRAEAFLRTLGKWQDTPAPLPPKADDPNHIAGAGF